MTRRLATLGLLTLATTAWANDPTHAQIESASWTFLSERDHDVAGVVKVYNAQIAGRECYQARVSVDLPQSAMSNVITDLDGALQWSTAGLMESKILGKKGNTLYYYQVLDVPGYTMASDRFWYNQGVVSQEGDEWTMRWSLLEEGGDYKDHYLETKARHSGAVFIDMNVGAWRLIPDGGPDKNKVTYSICSDSGGSLPAWLQAQASKQTLPDTVGDMIREAKKRHGGK